MAGGGEQPEADGERGGDHQGSAARQGQGGKYKKLSKQSPGAANVLLMFSG